MTKHGLQAYHADVTTVGVGEAKTHLSRLLKQVEDGDEVVIERDGTPVARLVAIARPRRTWIGMDQGTFTVPADFNDPLPPDLQQYFE